MSRTLTTRRGLTLLVSLGALAVTALAGSVTPAGGAPAAAEKAAAKSPLSGCGARRTVNHTFGTLQMTTTPRRIVTLEFSFVDALLAVGVRPVGLADDRDSTRILPQYRGKLGQYTSVGLRATPNLETIRSVNPDFIIADADRHRGIFRQLERIAPTIVLDSLQQAYLPNLHSARVIAQAVNRCAAMKKRLARHQRNMKKLRAAVPKNERRNAMFAVASRTGFNMHTSLAYTPSVLAALGLRATEQRRRGSDPYHELTLETLFTLNPDILFIGRAGDPVLSDRWQSNPIWQQLKSVRNRKVFSVNNNLWSRWRGISAAEVIGQQAIRLLYGKYVDIKIG